MKSYIRPTQTDALEILKLQRQQQTAQQISKRLGLQVSTVVQKMEPSKDVK